MKKFISILFVCYCALMFSSCGNEDLSMGNYTFTKAHISVGEKEVCVNVKSWHDNELGCEIKLENGNVLYLSEGSYILIKDTCPICNR